MTTEPYFISDIDDEHGHGCPARFGLGDCDEPVRVTYRAKTLCAICGKREDDLTVVMDGKVTGLCSVCWEKGDEAARDDESDLNREGDPAFNGAFNKW